MADNLGALKERTWRVFWLRRSRGGQPPYPLAYSLAEASTDEREAFEATIRAALCFLGCVDSQGNVYCPSEGAVKKAVEALEMAASAALQERLRLMTVAYDLTEDAAEAAMIDRK